MPQHDPAPTLIGLWQLHKAQCRPIGAIVEAARDGKLPGVKLIKSGFGFQVTDEHAAFAAMRR